MKTIKLITITYAFLILAVSCNSGTNNESAINSNKTSSFKVWGNCNMCKETIESSLKVEGIAHADWNTESKVITISYDSTKISLGQIQKNIASVGYDNDAYKGDDKTYSKLPECCQYERKL